MTRRTPWYFVVTFTDGRAERAIFYATSRLEAVRYAEAWARKLGVDVEPVEEDEA